MKNRLRQTESHRSTKYSLWMGLNSGKIREETARLHVTTYQRRKSTGIDRIKADSHIACRFHAVLLPCRAAKGLECVFPIWFTQCGRVWFTLAMPCSDHAVLFKATAQHGRRETAVLCCGLEKNGMVGAWHGKCESDTAALCKSNGKDTL